MNAHGEFDLLKQNIIDASVELTFANSVVANIHCAEAYDEQPRFVIETDRARIELINNAWMPNAKENKFKISAIDDKEESENEIVAIKSQSDAFYYQTQQFLSLIAEKGKNQPSPYPNIDDSKAIMALLTQWDVQCREISSA